MKWPLLDVPGSAGLKDSRSPTPGHLVSKSQNRTKFNPNNDKMCKRGSTLNSWHYRSLTNTLDCCTCTLQVSDVFRRFASVRASERLWNKLSAYQTNHINVLRESIYCKPYKCFNQTMSVMRLFTIMKLSCACKSAGSHPSMCSFPPQPATPAVQLLSSLSVFTTITQSAA